MIRQNVAPMPQHTDDVACIIKGFLPLACMVAAFWYVGLLF